MPSVSVRISIAKLMAKLRIPWFPLVEKHCCPQQPTDLLLNPCCLNIQYTENKQKEVSDDETDKKKKQLQYRMDYVLLITYGGKIKQSSD